MSEPARGRGTKHMTKEQKAKIKTQLNDLSRPKLIALLKDLMRLNNDNAAYIEAKLAAPSEVPEAAGYYKEIIRNEFFPSKGLDELHLNVAKKAIADFKKASRDTEAVLDLMIYYVENGTDYTRKYGDIDQRFYESMESVFRNVIQKLNGEGGRAFVGKFRPRLRKIVDDAKIVGWGYHENLDGMLDELEAAE